MPSQAEGNYINDAILWEEDVRYSRENVTVLSGENLATGQVVAKVTASGKIAEYDNAGTDGTETAYGILYAAVDATGGDADGVVFVGHCVAKKEGLTWFAAATAADITAGIADLEAAGIKVRDTV